MTRVTTDSTPRFGLITAAQSYDGPRRHGSGPLHSTASKWAPRELLFYRRQRCWADAARLGPLPDRGQKTDPVFRYFSRLQRPSLVRPLCGLTGRSFQQGERAEGESNGGPDQRQLEPDRGLAQEYERVTASGLTRIEFRASFRRRRSRLSVNEGLDSSLRCSIRWQPRGRAFFPLIIG